MSILKNIGIVVLILVAIPLVIALFVKKDYTVQRQIIINKPREDVFNYIKLLKNQDNYSKWVRTDPDMKKDFKGTDGTVGFVYAWDGNKKAGKGEQEITNIKQGERLDVEVRFIKPFESTAFAPMTTESVTPGQTRLTWALQGANKYPMNFMNLFMNKILGNDIDTSLVMLKGILEK